MKKYFTPIALLIAALPMACTSTSPQLSNNRVTLEKPIIKNLNEISDGFKKLQHSLVRLRISHQKQKEESYGTGFFYGSRDLLVTSQHLFNTDHECLVKLQCNINMGFAKDSKDVSEQSVAVEVVLKNPTKDIIFLKIKDASQLSHVQPLNIKAKNNKGLLTAAGFYQDNPALTFSQGQRLESSDGNNSLTSIIVSSGFSGSPIVNTEGELVGVVSSYKPIKGQKIGLAQFTSMDNGSEF